ncbi:MAG: hypothetical protein HY711_02945, partial [Candidatus Melainabacteria bacterium]|nr:hypothetical protein [Candidatus Melainabacteria bacterium]
RNINLATSLHDASLTFKDASLSVAKVGGQIAYDGRMLSFNRVAGTMGGGTFHLDGKVNLAPKPNLDVNFRATHIDLVHIERALRALHVQFPMLAQHRLYGRVKEITLALRGSPHNPTISLAVVPEDLFFQPPGLSRPLRAQSGRLTYNHDELVLQDVALVGQGTKLVTSLAVEHLSTKARLRYIKVKTTGYELSEINFFLSSPLMPPAMRKAYLEFLARHHVVSLKGKVYGDVIWHVRPKSNEFDFAGIVGLWGVTARVVLSNVVTLEQVSGILALAGSELIIQDLNGKVGRTSFVMDGHITNYRRTKAHWQVELKSRLYPAELMELVPGLSQSLQAKVVSTYPVGLKAMISGDEDSSLVVFSARANAADNLRVITQLSSFYQPPGIAITLDGSITVHPGASGSIAIHNSHLLIGHCLVQGQGKFSWQAPAFQAPAKLFLQCHTPNPVPAYLVASVLNPAIKPDTTGGEVQWGLTLEGPLSHLLANGRVLFKNVSCPDYNLYTITGRLEASDFTLVRSPEDRGTVSGKSQLFLDLATIGKLALNNIAAGITWETLDGTSQARIVIRDGTAKLAQGQLHVNGSFELPNHRVIIQAQLQEVQADEVMSQLLGHRQEINGLANAQLYLDSQGRTQKELMANLTGRGQIAILNGKVTRFGELQERLVQANLFQQGLFGFNLNNLLQTVVPVRTGEFRELGAHFSILHGVCSIDELHFSGDDMRLRAAGTVNLPLGTVQLDIAGNIPRVSSSLLAGPVGQLSKKFTIQKLVQILTLHKLEALPSFPILGDLATDRPRAFVFQVASPLGKPEAIVQSIEKSFHWLPNYPNATAHPVPGLR